MSVDILYIYSTSDKYEASPLVFARQNVSVKPWVKSKQVVFTKESCTVLVPRDQDFPSVIKTECDGRLGNQMSVYATSWFFSQNYGLQPIFHETQIARISEVFKRKKLRMAAVCEIEKNITKKWENIFELNHDRYFFYKRFRENPEQFLKNRLLDIGRYTNALYFYKNNMEELRQQFQFKDKIRRAAEEAMQSARYIFTSSITSDESSLVYVGVHSRRTDLISSHHRPAARYDRIDGRFYNTAAAMFRFKYNTLGQRVVFVAASDDPNWLKQNLYPENRDVVFTADLFEGKMPTGGEDLAVLSMCNHTIIGAGTYAQWGALLAGGEVIYPTGYGTLETAEESTISRAEMENWRAINISLFS